MIPVCEHCGESYDFELIEEAEYDEDGDLVEPPELAYFPMCKCEQMELALLDA